jgi:hypothetical protein
MNGMNQRTNGRICKQWRPERSFGKRRRSDRMSQEPAEASFLERIPGAGSCSRVGERAVGALGSSADGFPVLSQVVPSLVRRFPPRSELATSSWKAHCPRVAQRAALSAQGASQARSMLALFPGKGSEISLPAFSRSVRKDAFKPDS